MDYIALDHLSLFADHDHSRLKKELLQNRIIDQRNNFDINMINIRTGTFTSEIVRNLANEQYDIQLIYDHLLQLITENEVRAAYYFLYSVIKALDINMPPLFIQICAIPDVMKAYLSEFLTDYQDCMTDYLSLDTSD